MEEKDLFEMVKKGYSQKADGYSRALGQHLKEVYCPNDIKGLVYEKDLGNPGEYPFSRGIHSNMYRGRLWTMREFVGYGTPQDTRERILKLASSGATAITIAPDLVTSAGIDPDHPLAAGEIGTDGVPLSSLRDMETLLEGIPIERVNVNLVLTSCVAPIVLAQYIALAEERHADVTKLRGTVSNCPIKDYFCSHKAGAPDLKFCLKTAGDVIEYCTKNMPLFNPFNSNVASFRNMGISPAMEIAIGLAIAFAHIEEARERGLKLEELARRFAFFMATEMEFFEEIAKHRSARRMWATLLKEKIGINDERSLQLKIGDVIAGHILFSQEPMNNIARLTAATLAAALGGAQSIQVPGYDEGICLPTEEAHRLSLRIQQILAFETGIANVADPLGGSYYVEYLTSRIEEQAMEILAELEEKGGITSDGGSRWLANELEESLLKLYGGIDSGDVAKVGVNVFAAPIEKETTVEVQRIPPDVSEKQLKVLKELKRDRDNEKVRTALKEIYEAAVNREGENLMPYILQAVRAYATTGEIFGTMLDSYDIRTIH